MFDKLLSAIADQDDWKRIRSIMSPTFSSGKMRRMQPLIDECVQTMIKNFNNLTKSGATEMDVKKVFGAFSMDIVITVAFGTKVDSLIDEDNPIISHARKIFNRKVDIKALSRLILIILFPKLARLLNLSFL